MDSIRNNAEESGPRAFYVYLCWCSIDWIQLIAPPFQDLKDSPRSCFFKCLRDDSVLLVQGIVSGPRSDALLPVVDGPS